METTLAQAQSVQCGLSWLGQPHSSGFWFRGTALPSRFVCPAGSAMLFGPRSSCVPQAGRLQLFVFFLEGRGRGGGGHFLRSVICWEVRIDFFEHPTANSEDNKWQFRRAGPKAQRVYYILRVPQDDLGSYVYTYTYILIYLFN